LASCNYTTPNTFILEGEIVGLADSTELVLSYLTLDNNKWVEVKNTVYIIDKKFTFRGDINELTAAFLDLDNTFIRLYLEPATMKLKLNKDQPWEYELSDTKTERENIVLREKLKSNEEKLYKESNIAQNIIDQINSYKEETSERDSLINILKLDIVKQITAIKKQIGKIQLNYVLENKNSKIVPDLIYLMARSGLVGIDTLKNTYDNLHKDLKMTILGKLAYKQIEQTEQLINGGKITEGSIAPYFSGIDISGKEIKSSDFYEQNYVLLDFWASWCKPCLEQVPQVKRIYSNYFDKGLKIIGLSVDEDKKQWANAIEKYKLGDWPQILSKPDSNSDYFARDISNSYGVEYIPRYFLIDNQGKIVAKWEHMGEDEISFLENLLSNKNLYSTKIGLRKIPIPIGFSGLNQE
jgi:peroxiredoxin